MHMKSNLFLLAIIGALICGCKDEGILLPDDNIAQVELGEISSDIQLISIKSSQPMKDILICQSYGNYEFLLSSDYRTIYCVEGDTVISVLNKAGRGRGEYLSINTFAYSTEDSLMYVVENDGKMSIYKGFDYEFVGVINNLPRMTSIRVIENNKLLAVCTVPDDDIEVRFGFFIIDTKTGQISEPLLRMSYLGMFSHNDNDYYRHNDSIYFSVGDNEINRVYLYYKGELTPKLEFMYSKKMRLPNEVLVGDLNDINEFLRFNEYIKNHSYCVGANYPIVKNDGDYFTFWSFPEAGDNILNIISNNRIKRYHINIPGIIGFVAPDYVSRDYYVALYQNMSKDENADRDGNSDLAERMFEEYDNNEGNPLLLKFKIK